MTETPPISAAQLARDLGKWCLKRQACQREIIMAVLLKHYAISRRDAEELAGVILNAVDEGKSGFERNLPVRLQSAKREDKCAKCGKTTLVGSSIYWHPRSKSVWHDSCERHFHRKYSTLVPARQISQPRPSTGYFHDRDYAAYQSAFVVRGKERDLKDMDQSVKRRSRSRTQELMEHYEPEFSLAAEAAWDRVLEKYSTSEWLGRKKR